MESVITKESEKMLAENKNFVNTSSVENFQKFIYELFEKNGILNDLRAYLRGHIVNVIRNAKTGDTPACHKLFTQRLELNYQALNILIVEYFMRSEFPYSLSVFVSEIPLANMVFEFAKTLMQKCKEDETEIRFTDDDVWAILNYLGVQCDSEHALKVLEMYNNDKKSSLLLCMLKCLPMYQIEPLRSSEQAISSKETLSSGKSSNVLIDGDEPAADKCKHLAYCCICQARMLRHKVQYKQKKKYLYKNVKSMINPLKSEELVKSIDVLERSLIEEMFQELKSVYEAEMGMVKVEEENKWKRCLSNHSLMLQKQRDELEESFKLREAELEENMTQKKKFLWGLARSLRDQHQHLTAAMRDVRDETDRLYAKEESLKAQMEEAEQILKKRGEEMRMQISEELAVLDGHLTAMKQERDSINKEREELEHLKNVENTNNKISKIQIMASEELHTHYGLLKNELSILKKYLESSKLSPKCVIERGTMTEPADVGSNTGLNNCATTTRSRHDDDKLKDQVVNDLKTKNSNFSQCMLDELYHESTYCPSRSSGSSEAGDSAAKDRLTLHRLRHENYRLRACAKQQKSQIEALSRAVARGTSASRAGPAPAPHTPRAGPAPAPPAPRPAPATNAATLPSQPTYLLQNVNNRASTNIHATASVGWRKGAGEELSMFRDAQPRILVPGDEIPFVGVLRDRERHSTRRQLLSQWRALRARSCRLSGVSRNTGSSNKNRAGTSAVVHDQPAPGSRTDEPAAAPTVREHHHRSKPVCLNGYEHREKSPKSVLREAKEKLRNIKDTSVAAREKSPSSVLREAKLRLRKLEIEAEAVEKSYMDYRRKQSELKLERNARVNLERDITRSMDVMRNIEGSISTQKLEDTDKKENKNSLADFQRLLRTDFDKYLRDYQTDFNKINISLSSQNSQTPQKEYSKINAEENNEVNNDFLETPLDEFRKLYNSRQLIKDESQISENMFENRATYNLNEASNQGSTEYVASRSISPSPTPTPECLRKSDGDKLSINILQRNLDTLLNLANDMGAEPAITMKGNENLLRVEVESVSEIKAECQDMSLVVQNTIDIREVSMSTHNTRGSASAQLTVIVSPRASAQKSGENISLAMQSTELVVRSPSPEQEARLTRNDVLDAIFHGSSDDKRTGILEGSPTNGTIEESVNEEEDFPDNFSADVDNYNSRSASVNSPISLVKSSEDEIFWE